MACNQYNQNNIPIEDIIPDTSISNSHENKLAKIIEDILNSFNIESRKKNPNITRPIIQKWIEIAKKNNKCSIQNVKILDFYLEKTRKNELPYIRQLHLSLIKKLVKSHSGVSVISVLTSAHPEYIDKKTGEKKIQTFSCPHQCVYCPSEPGQPKSYLSGEPAVSRAIRSGYDTYTQIMDRTRALIRNGHQVDKIEYIVLGGTWSCYPTEYQEEFIRDLYYSANVMYENNNRKRLSLHDEITINQTAGCRVIGLTLETRPDTITENEILKLRSYGCTRVQLGVQHIHDDVLQKIKRGCKNKHTIRAIHLLKDAGFKVDIHLMPDLPGSNYQKDEEMMTDVISKQEYQVDHHKWYTTAVVGWSELEQLYKEGKYKPWAEGEEGQLRLFNLLARMYMRVPEWTRVNRIIRDIPKPDIIGGNNNVSMRQDLDRFMVEHNLRPREIRTREVKSNTVNWNRVELITKKYLASYETEYFISYEDVENDLLLGFIKLRLPNRKKTMKHYIPALHGSALIRELHVYGILSMVGNNDKFGDKIQHRGLGKRLLKIAENIAFKNGYGKTAIIAGVGVRQYYAKFGYNLEDTYMTKNLTDTLFYDESIQNNLYYIDVIYLIILLILYVNCIYYISNMV
jgi:ELP3 family radical SAM enzyme/protein acetyltransferase